MRATSVQDRSNERVVTAKVVIVKVRIDILRASAVPTMVLHQKIYIEVCHSHAKIGAIIGPWVIRASRIDVLCRCSVIHLLTHRAVFPASAAYPFFGLEGRGRWHVTLRGPLPDS